jgi:hypothetical protein
LLEEALGLGVIGLGVEIDRDREHLDLYVGGLCADVRRG